jgi:hypothetical protein
VLLLIALPGKPQESSLRFSAGPDTFSARGGGLGSLQLMISEASSTKGLCSCCASKIDLRLRFNRPNERRI